VLTSSFRESPRIISLATYASGRPRRLTNAPIDTISLLAVSWGGPLKREKR
jgi:hypothetical protein